MKYFVAYEFRFMANYKTYLLKDELKNVAGPNAYALIAISNMKAHKNTNSA